MIPKILKEFNFKKEKITRHDKIQLAPFIVKFPIKIKEKLTSRKIFDKKEIKRILESKPERIFLKMCCFLDNYLSPKRKELKLFSGEIIFEYIGSCALLFNEYATLPLCDIFFFCKDRIILWDHDGYLTVYKFERIKTERNRT